MNEEFLYYVWSYQLLKYPLISMENLAIEVIHPGTLNKNSGPDFFNARINIGDTTWAGNIEIHVKSSDWYKHGHHDDEKYQQIILHVVWENDQEIEELNKMNTATLVLRDRIMDDVFKHYQYMMQNRYRIPCRNEIATVNRHVINQWVDRLVEERLKQRASIIAVKLENNIQHWEQTFFISLAANLGFKVNSVPFELLARSIPLHILYKHKNNLFQIESILYGQAGMLQDNFIDDYPVRLQKEYGFLQHKYSLVPMDPALWQFFRIRPANFPTIRISQMAQMIVRSSHLWSKILAQAHLAELVKLFNVPVNDYWKSHFRFDVNSRTSVSALGKQAAYLIIINTVVPYLFYYGERNGDVAIKDKALKLLDQIPGETNALIRDWKRLGMDVHNACQTQALLHLETNYCKLKKCLSCDIGHAVFRSWRR